MTIEETQKDLDQENPEKRNCCIKCYFYDARNSFCRFDPPKIMLDTNGYYVTCWPKITCPFLDWCSHYQSINKK